MNRVLQALGTVLAVAFGARIAWEVLLPVAPAAGVLLMFALIGWVLLGGPRSR
jgi:hypothetical protein